MPKKLHEKLEKTAKRKKLKGKRRSQYIYGTMKEVEKRKNVKRRNA